MSVNETLSNDELTSIVDHNLAVAQEIKQYCDYPKSQQFAIMVDGPWGSGKTHLVNNLLNELIQTDSQGKGRKPIYISLYGIKDSDEIDEQIHQQLHPILTHRYTRIAGIVFKGLLKTAIKVDFDKLHESVTVNSQIPDIDLAEVVSGAPGRILIFDDFERAVIPPVGVLAYINQLVEHDDCKVIILVNESEILKSKTLGETAIASYRTQKEKTIGRTFRVRANAYAAYRTLIDKIEDSLTREFLLAESDTVLNIFRDSKSENLRLLRQFVWDFERLWSAFTAAQRAHTTGMREILGILYAITLEIRAGNIQPDGPLIYGITQRMQVQNGTADEKTVAISKLEARYPSVDFDSALLTEGTIRALVQYSIIDRVAIQRQLQGHPYFMEPDEQPTWRTLWNSSKLDEDGLNDTLQWFSKDFEQRTFQATGEIMHVVGLSLWLASIGQDGWEDGSIVNRLKQYIDDVCKDADWDLISPNTDAMDLTIGGAFGYMFYERDSTNFRLLAAYLDTAAAAARRRHYPKIAENLKGLMKSDSEAFLRQVSFTNAGPSTYAMVGVLSAIPPEEFTSILVGLPYNDQSTIAMAISIRYDQAPAYEDLKAELPWVADVYARAANLLPLLAPIRRFHFNNLLESYLRKHSIPPRAGVSEL